jgi:FMN phosphatase YigB (HAD superfamily)
MIRNIEEKWIRLFPKKTIDGLIFDLDDTLINQKVWITDKIRIMHQQYKNFLPEKKLFLFVAYRFLEEGKRSTLIDDLISHFNLPNSLRDDLIPAFRIAEPESIYVFKDVLQNLLRLKKTGLKLALLTDNPPSSQRQKLEKLNFKDIFDVIVFSQDLNLEKPEKRVFDEVSNQICISPNKLAMVGDNLYRDIYGALNAGHNFAFYLERKNTFFNFDFDKFIEVSGLATDRIIKITSLNDLYFSLENPITH